MSGHRVSYTYNNPGPAGPFRGSLVTKPGDDPPKKGEVIRAMFGVATVTKVSKPKA
jgi:hypothetical protein